MKCPKCGHSEDKVLDSRAKRGGLAIRRRRQCLDCNNRFTTYEYIEESPLLVLKRDGRSEPFDRNKIHKALSIALVKRHVSAEKIEITILEIEENCHSIERREVESSEIGEMIMSKLRDIDEVAYIRFASVYREFQDLGAFRREIENM